MPNFPKFRAFLGQFFNIPKTWDKIPKNGASERYGSGKKMLFFVEILIPPGPMRSKILFFVKILTKPCPFGNFLIQTPTDHLEITFYFLLWTFQTPRGPIFWRINPLPYKDKNFKGVDGQTKIQGGWGEWPKVILWWG